MQNLQEALKKCGFIYANYIILLGFTLAGALRGLLIGIIVLIVSFFFTHLHIIHPGMVIFVAFLSAMLFALAGLINGILARSFDDISYIPTFILTPLTYLGGIFYSIKQLPEFWQHLSIFNPIFNIVDAFKYGTLGLSDSNIYFDCSLMSLLFIILLTCCMFLLKKGMD